MNTDCKSNDLSAKLPSLEGIAQFKALASESYLTNSHKSKEEQKEEQNRCIVLN